MKLLLILLTSTTLHLQSLGKPSNDPNVYHQSVIPNCNSCKCDGDWKYSRIKRSAATAQTDPNMKQQVFDSDAPVNIISDGNFENGVIPIDTHNSNQKSENGEDDEVVGIAGLGRLHALRARARIHALTARARLHPPFLLEPTPEQFLHDDVNPQQEKQTEDDETVLQRASIDSKFQPLPMQEQHGFDPLKTKHFESFGSSSTTKKEQPRNFKERQLETHLTPSTSVQQIPIVLPSHPNKLTQHENKEQLMPNQHFLRYQNGDYFMPEMQNEEVVESSLAPTFSMRNPEEVLESYENRRSFSAIPTVYYKRGPENPNMPHIRIYDIDNGEKVYQNRKPGFSIIPSNWKPPPDSNLYSESGYSEYSSEKPVLSVLPGKWKDNNDYTTYYNYYDVVPISYDIPDIYYGRSAEPQNSQQTTAPFVGVKQQLQGWGNNPLVWRPTSDKSTPAEEKQRDADPPLHNYNEDEPQFANLKPDTPLQQSGFAESPASFQTQNSGVAHSLNQSSDEKQRDADPHFHHSHSHAHALIHQHILNHGKEPQYVFLNHDTPLHPSEFSKPSAHFETQNSGFTHFQDHPQSYLPHPSGHISEHQSSFSQSQARPQNSGFSHSGHISEHQSSFSQSQAHAQNSGFSHPHGTHGQQVTINKQQTTVIVPPGSGKNVQISQVAGTNNAVSQAQSSNKGFPNAGFLPGTHQNIQSAQVSGNQNSVSQSQASNEAPFRSKPFDPVVGAPFLVFSPKRRKVYRDSDSDVTILRLVVKRSIDDNATDNMFDRSSNVLNSLHDKSKLLKQLQNTTKNDRDLQFVTSLGSDMLDDFMNKLNVSSRSKRSVPLLRLIADPNAKLDVPTTLENMGTVMRNSFENKRTPVYHIKNVLGSTKDAFLSALKIPPQDLFIPSKYKIVDRESANVVQSANPMYRKNIVGAINPSLFQRARDNSLRKRIKSKTNEVPSMENPKVNEIVKAPPDPENFEETYKRVGSMLRESIRSGQEALAHMGEVYHSARKALATSRHVAPRVILSSMRVPTLQRNPSLIPHNDKVLLITPKVLQLKQEAVGAPHYSENNPEFIGVSHVMDSLGLSRPGAGPLGLRRTVLHPTNFAPPRLQNKPDLPNLQARSNFDDDSNDAKPKKFNKENLTKKMKKYFILADAVQAGPSEQNVKDTLEALDNAKQAVGAKTLKDFVSQMRDGFSTVFKDRLEEAKNKFSVRLATRKGDSSDATSKIKLLSEFKLKPRVLKSDTNKQNALDVVSKLLNPTNDLEEASNTGAASQPVEVGHLQEEEQEITNFLTNLFKPQPNTSNMQNQDDNLSPDTENTEPLFTPTPEKKVNDEKDEVNDDADNMLGAGLPLSQQLLKPFMGRASQRQRHKFFEEFGDSVEESAENENEDENAQDFGNNQEVIAAINPILFRKDCNNINETHFICRNQTDTKTNAQVLNKNNSSVENRVTEDGHTNNAESFGAKMDKNSKLNNSNNNNTKANKKPRLENDRTETIAVTTKIDNNTKLNDGENTNTDSNKKPSEENQTETIGISMKIGKKLLTPFMGKLVKEEVQVYPPTGYNDGYAYDSGEYNYRNSMNEDEHQGIDLPSTASPSNKNKKSSMGQNKQQREETLDVVDQNTL